MASARLGKFALEDGTKMLSMPGEDGEGRDPLLPVIMEARVGVEVGDGAKTESTA